MPRPTNKSDLINTSQEKYDKLLFLIKSMSEEEQLKPFTFDLEKAGKEAHWKRDKNIRDVLIHLYEWHQLLLNWVGSNQDGEAHSFLPAPYNWKTYGQMNIAFWEKHQNTSYNKSKTLLEKSHFDVIKLIESFSTEELFTKKYYDWTGTTTLGSYCISATSSHYDWAMKKIRKHLKSFK